MGCRAATSGWLDWATGNPCETFHVMIRTMIGLLWLVYHSQVRANNDNIKMIIFYQLLCISIDLYKNELNFSKLYVAHAAEDRFFFSFLFSYLLYT